MAAIYKICPAALWRDAEREGVFAGSPVDTVDGFIHFSTGDADRLGPALRYEPSRGGDLFPHLYDRLFLDAVLWARPLRLGADGRHILPELAA